MSNDQQDIEKKILDIIRDAAKQDDLLREKYQIGTKFRFVRDRLQEIVSRLENNLAHIHTHAKSAASSVATTDVLVFVHLFNAHGDVVRSWQNMLQPNVFYEYSVNRPIFKSKLEIEALLKSKRNKLQHGFVTIALDPAEILAQDDIKDADGNALIKVREGSLVFEKFISFTHNEHVYTLNDKGELVNLSYGQEQR